MLEANRKILLVMPTFHGFENSIKNELEKTNTVDLISYSEKDLINFKNGIYAALAVFLFLGRFFFKEGKILSKINYLIHSLKDFTQLNNFITNGLKGRYDKILVIKGFGISRSTIRYFGSFSENIILYQWDSLDRFPNVIKTYDLYDRIYTYEFRDLKKYPKSIYYPTFYIPQHFSEEKKVKNNIEYHLVYVGTFTFERYFKLKKITTELKKNNLKYHFTLVNTGYFRIPFHDNDIFLRNESLSIHQVYQIYRCSAGILDLGHSGQSGLTTRVYEALYLGKNYVSYDQISKEILRIDEDIKNYTFSIQEFLVAKKINIPNHITTREIVKKYSLKNWLHHILN